MRRFLCVHDKIGVEAEGGGDGSEHLIARNADGIAHVDDADVSAFFQFQDGFRHVGAERRETLLDVVELYLFAFA